MTSEVDICNLALAGLGDEANIAALDEGSMQADHCARFYPIARNALLAMHPWNGASRRSPLALLDAGDQQPSGWAYCYGKPSESVRIVAVLPIDSPSNYAALYLIDPLSPYNTLTRPGDQNAQEFIQETLDDGTEVIFTNVEDAVARYTALVTDTTKYNALFVPALARLLMSYLAGPILKGADGRKEAAAQLQMFMKIEYPAAVLLDVRGQRVNVVENFIPSSIVARQ